MVNRKTKGGLYLDLSEPAEHCDTCILPLFYLATVFTKISHVCILGRETTGPWHGGVNSFTVAELENEWVSMEIYILHKFMQCPLTKEEYSERTGRRIRNVKNRKRELF